MPAPVCFCGYNASVNQQINPNSPRDVRRILADYGIRPSRKLGQNFLIDRNILAQIAEAGGLSDEDVCLEIGGGLGSLTDQLWPRCRHVLCVELDARLADLLRQRFGGNDRVEIIHQDFLKVDIPDLLREWDASVRAVANIPYSITTPIIEKLVAHKDTIRSVTLLVQKEVALRMLSEPGTTQYSSFTVFCRLHSEMEIHSHVPRHLFIPAPEVDSAVITMRFRHTGLTREDETRVERVVRASFGQRRKTLLNALSAGLGLAKADTAIAITEAGIDPAVRAEDLDVAQFMTLAASAAEQGLV